MDVGVREAEQHLAALGVEAAGVEPIGAGAWSSCFAFEGSGRRLVVRYGEYLEDFRKDRRARAYAGPDLPVPEVLDAGEAFGGYYAISAFAPGAPLETSTAAEWSRLVVPVARALEAMRTAAVPEGAGWGGWDGDGCAVHRGWRDFLLAVGDDAPVHRTHGWRAKLAASPGGDAAFLRGYRLLAEVATDDVPRALIHGDLVNRNVHVSDGAITGIFDWGCGAYGDHLYELAWFEFWAPWQPALDPGALRSALGARWAEAGYTPLRRDGRMAACHLHIGLDHLAYNAHLEDWQTMAEVEARMQDLVGI